MDVKQKAGRQERLLDELAGVVETLRDAVYDESSPGFSRKINEAAHLVEQLQAIAEPGKQNGLPVAQVGGVADSRQAGLDIVWQWESEREALADSLRAGAGQLLANTIAELSACRLLLKTMPSDQVQPGLMALENELRSELVRFQALISELRPPLELMDDVGLYASLLLYSKNCLRDRGVNVRIQHPSQPLPLSRQSKLVIYRMVQAAIRQAELQHRATNIEVDLDYSANAVTIEIVDDGLADQASPESTPVLLNLQQLADLVMADMTTVETSNLRTAVRFRIPMSPRRL